MKGRSCCFTFSVATTQTDINVSIFSPPERDLQNQGQEFNLEDTPRTCDHKGLESKDVLLCRSLDPRPNCFTPPHLVARIGPRQKRMSLSGLRHDFLYRLRPRPDCCPPALVPDRARHAGHALEAHQPPSVPVSAAPLTDDIKPSTPHSSEKGRSKQLYILYQNLCPR